MPSAIQRVFFPVAFTAAFGSVASEDMATQIEHAKVERLAKDHIYAYGKAGGMSGDDATRAAMKKDGFDVKASIEDSDLKLQKGEVVEKEAGFAAMVVEPPGNTVYLVFRGTDDATDVGDYLSRKADKEGQGGYEVTVGREQYAKFKKQLDAVVERYRNTGRKIVVSGHSLGGALAQRFVADHPEFVDEMILFQSPGVEKELVDKMDAHVAKGGKFPKSRLYVSEWDKVPDFGHGHIGNPEVVVGSFTGLNQRSVVASHRVFFNQKDKARSPYGDKAEYSSIAKLSHRKTVSYLAYSQHRKVGGDLTGLSDGELVGVAGTWQSSWGPVTLSHPALQGNRPAPISGSFQQPNDGTGTITGGSWNPATGRLEFEYYQPWNKMPGKATLTLSKDGKQLTGGYKQPNASGSWTMTR
ncbi:MAG: DUF2974 domain-containing protein [Myxococcales bacterium]|nr:DUF2974 domain-containing protein [Myxococcales bacterium]